MKFDEQERKTEAEPAGKPQRLRRGERMVVGRIVLGAAMSILRQQRPRAAGPFPGTVWARVGTLDLLFTTPNARFIGQRAPFGVDIWTPGRKVFSGWWFPVEIPCFQAGGWIDELVGSVQRSSPAEEVS